MYGWEGSFVKMDCIEGLCQSQYCHSISWSSKTIISFVNHTIIHIRKSPVLIWLTILWSGVLQPWNVLLHFCQWMNRSDPRCLYVKHSHKCTSLSLFLNTLHNHQESLLKFPHLFLNMYLVTIFGTIMRFYLIEHFSS